MKCLVAVAILASAALAALPPQASVSDLTTGPTGTLYAAGATPGGGFIAQLPDGFVYRTTFPIAAIASGIDGAIYATGTMTNSAIADFGYPVSLSRRSFVLKLNSTGELQYQHLIDGPPSTTLYIAVNDAGEAVVSGQINSEAAVAFPVTPGAVAPNLMPFLFYGFLVKLDATGRQALVSIVGYGGGPVAFDKSGNIFTASTVNFTDILPTSTAIQTRHSIQSCSGTNVLSIPCDYQYLAKLSPNGTKLIYSTYLTGTYGATPTSLVIDSAGNAIVAGTTYSHDYPVTSGAFQQSNLGTVVYVPAPDGANFAHPPVIPPASAGFVSKVNADGASLLWSTYYGGTGLETISSAKVDRDGNIVFAGLTASADLPGSSPAPPGCELNFFQQQPYLAKLSADGASILGGTYIYNIPAIAPKLAVASQSLYLGSGDIVAQDTPVAPSPAACLSDSADLKTVDRLAPGQLLTLFTKLGATILTIFINGIPAPTLYSGPSQTNFRVPAELSVEDTATLTVTTPDGVIARDYRVVPAAPSVFVTPVAPDSPCLTYFNLSNPIQPIVRNENGSINSCNAPAAFGSVVTLYVNGLGADPSVLSVKATGLPTTSILSVEPDPDSPAGVSRIRVNIPSFQFPPFFSVYTGVSTVSVTLQFDQLPVREASLTLFIKPFI